MENNNDIGDLIAGAFGGEVVKNNEQEAQVVDLTTEQPQQEEAPSVQEEPSQVLDLTADQTQEESSSIKEESSLNTESSDSTSDYLSDLNQKLGSDFESVEQLVERFNELSDTPKEESYYANEQLEAMDKFVRETGRSVNDFLRTQTVDYGEMSNDNVVKEYLRMNNPDLSKEEIDVYFESQYKSSEQEEGKITPQSVQLKKDAAIARKELKEIQESYKMPSEANYNSEEEQQLRQEFVDSMSNEVDAVESIEFDINDSGETFTYALSEEQKALAKETSQNLDGYFDKYVDRDGNWDYDSLAMDMFIRDNFEAIVRAVANQYKSKGTEQVIDEIKNPSFSPEQKDVQSDKSVLDQVSEQIFKGSSFWNR
jgi:hypothetical protein